MMMVRLLLDRGAQIDAKTKVENEDVTFPGLKSQCLLFVVFPFFLL